MEKGVLRNLAKFTGKDLRKSQFFNKVAGLRPETLLKKGLWHRCFPVNFLKFPRTPFLQNTSGRLLLPFGKTGNFAKNIFYFLRADEYSICEVEITGKPVNLGNCEGMQVPCEVKLTGRRKFENVLQNSLKTKK